MTLATFCRRAGLGLRPPASGASGRTTPPCCDASRSWRSGNEPVNLANREADVAIRVVYDRNALPRNLHGLKGLELFGGVYISRDLLTAGRAGAFDRIRWIVMSQHGIRD